MLENAEYIKAGELLDHTQKLYDEGAIFCTASCVDLGNEFEVIYHYNLENGLRMKHLRLKVDKNETVPSISNIYLCASLIENEMQELYQLKLSKIAIDFSGGFLVTKETPTSYMIKAPDYKLIPVERLTAPCQRTCPAGIDVSRYVRLCGEGNYDAALAVIKQAMPFPGILGRVCLAPCESACRQGKCGEAISIKQLKRAAYEYGHYTDTLTAKPTGKKVAVVGSGPAGLAAAYFLAKKGHKVTVFEALPKAGGYMRVGIPEYALPRQILDAEIENVAKLGVEFKLGTAVNSLHSLKEMGFDATLLALGANQGVRRSNIIAAFSGATDVFKKFGLAVENINGSNVLKVDDDTLSTSQEGVFACGDAVNGPTSVIHAVASGKKAAASIDKYLGSDGKWVYESIVAHEPISRDTFLERILPKSKPLSVEYDIKQAKERNEETAGYSREVAAAEGKRCWRCDLEE